MLGHQVVGLRAVSEALAKDLITKGSLVNLDKLTASRKTVDLAGDARLEHAAETLSLGVLDGLVQRPETPVLAVIVNTDVATYTDKFGILADLPQHLPDAVFIKDGISIHAHEVLNVFQALDDEGVADMLEEVVVEHGHDVDGALVEMVQERTGKAQAVALALVVPLTNEKVGQSLVVTGLNLGGHEETIASAVSVLKEARWTGLEDVLQEVLLSGLLHTRALDVAVDNDENHARVLVNVLLRYQGVKRASELFVRFVVAWQKHDHAFRGLRDLFFAAEAPEDGLEEEVADNEDDHDELEDRVGAEQNDEEVVGDMIGERDVNERGIDAEQTDEKAPLLEPQQRLRNHLELCI